MYDSNLWETCERFALEIRESGVPAHFYVVYILKKINAC